jgi:ubiquinone/menaquinone biosynthesis C-methylase UbiE
MFHSPPVTFEKARRLANHVHSISLDLLTGSIYQKIINALDINRDSIILHLGAWAYWLEDPDLLKELLPPSNLVVCDINISKLETWWIFGIPGSWGYEQGSVTPVPANVSQLPFPDESIDMVYSKNLVNDPWFTWKEWNLDVFFQEAKRVLKPGGMIFLNTFGYLVYKKPWFNEEYCIHCPMDQIITQQDLISYLQKYEFVDIQTYQPTEDVIRDRINQSQQKENLRSRGVMSIWLLECGWITARIPK